MHFWTETGINLPLAAYFRQNSPPLPLSTVFCKSTVAAPWAYCRPRRVIGLKKYKQPRAFFFPITRVIMGAARLFSSADKAL